MNENFLKGARIGAFGFAIVLILAVMFFLLLDTFGFVIGALGYACILLLWAVFAERLVDLWDRYRL